MTDAELIRLYEQNGYVNVPRLFSKQETYRYREHFMTLRQSGSYPGDSAGVDAQSNDPLKQYPRMIHMHRWDQVSLDWLLDSRLNRGLSLLLGREPYAVQTMLYFKPPGARGQALHQDQVYLRARPGTCMAAWMALDRCDEENGCLQIVAGSHKLPLLCTTEADTKKSFTNVTVPLPQSINPDPVIMDPGDVLFFHGQVIHGSYPNTSSNRFRCALIGHYISGEAEQVAAFYQPLLRMDGTELEIEKSQGGSPCGVWVERDGKPVVEMNDGSQPLAYPTHLPQGRKGERERGRKR